MRLLDLYAGAGGAAVGYQRAGFDVVGVDLHPQPTYPFELLTMNVLELPVSFLRLFDAVHASPPCQTFSTATASTGNRHDWPDLVVPTRHLLNTAGVPWVMENVPQAPLRPDVTLCGSMFGLQIRRHRVFELGGWWMLDHGRRCEHTRQGRTVDVTGNAGGANQTDRAGYPIKYHDTAHARRVMGMAWADRSGCVEAIPPVYTELIGHQLRQAILS